MGKYGDTVDELYYDLTDLRSAALNRKFDVSYLDRSDLIPLTRDAKDLIKGEWFE